MNNIVHSLLENDQADRPFLEGLGQTAYQFAPVKGLVGSIALDHPQVGALDFFVSGVAIGAFQAFPAATNAETFSRLARIDNLVVPRPTLRTTHSGAAAYITQQIVASTVSLTPGVYFLSAA